MKKRLLSIIWLILTALFLCAGCSPAPVQTAAAVSLSPASAATPTVVPTPSPTPEPTPAITEEWYVQRTEDMAHWMRLYGDMSEEQIAEKLRRMEIDPEKPMVTLTFDDGPMAGISDKIVDILAEYDCRATFYMRGARMKYDATVPLLKKILAGGNEIGNHTWKHQILTSTPYGDVVRTIRQVNDSVYEATGYTIKTLRPPGGYCGPTVCKIAEKFGLAVALWAQSGNVHERDPARIAENVHKQIVNGKALQPGDIILLHDTKPWMVDAVRLIVPQLLDEGYQLVTVTELMNLSDRGFVPGEKYHKQFESATPTPEPPVITPNPALDGE